MDVSNNTNAASLGLTAHVVNVGILVTFPHDNAPLQALQYLLVALTAGISITFFVGGFALAAIQDE